MSDTNQMDDKPELGCITKLFDEAPTVEPGVTGRLHYDKASHTIRGDKSIEYDDPIHDAIGTLPYLLSMLRQKEPPSEWDEKNVWQLQRDLRAYYDTIQSRLREAEAAIDAAKLKWQTGQPTQDGWYWMQLNGEPWIFHYCEQTPWADFTSYKWAGPLEPPAEKGAEDDQV